MVISKIGSSCNHLSILLSISFIIRILYTLQLRYLGEGCWVSLVIAEISVVFGQYRHWPKSNQIN